MKKLTSVFFIIFFCSLTLTTLTIAQEVPPTSFFQKIKTPLTQAQNVYQKAKGFYQKLTPRVRRTCAVVGLLTLPFIKPIVMDAYKFLVSYHFNQQAKHYVDFDRIKPIKSNLSLATLKRTIPPVILDIKQYCTHKRWFPFITNYFYPCSQKTPCSIVLIYNDSDKELIELMHRVAGDVTVFCRNLLMKEELQNIYTIAKNYDKSIVWFHDHEGRYGGMNNALYYLLHFLELNPTYDTITTIVTTSHYGQIKNGDLREKFDCIVKYEKPSTNEKKDLIDSAFESCKLTRTKSCDDLFRNERLSATEIKRIIRWCNFKANENGTTEISSKVAQDALEKINRETLSLNRVSLYS